MHRVQPAACDAARSLTAADHILHGQQHTACSYRLDSQIRTWLMCFLLSQARTMGTVDILTGLLAAEVLIQSCILHERRWTRSSRQCVFRERSQ